MYDSETTNNAPSQSVPSNTSTIYINPRFRNAHINPNFLSRKLLPPQPTNIHINPLFLPVPAVPQSTVIHSAPVSARTHMPTVAQPPKATIISQTSRKLVRQPTVVAPVSKHPSLTVRAQPFVRIGKRKLVRAHHPSGTQAQNHIVKKKPRSGPVVLDRNAYKIDRRDPGRGATPGKRTTQVHRIHNNPYLNEILTSNKVIVSDRRLLRIGTASHKAKPAKPTKNFKLLNINGVFYRSTVNKLHRHSQQSTSHSAPSIKTAPKERTLFVRGAKFSVDKGGKRLRRITEAVPSVDAASAPATLHRIHIGGMTYSQVAPNTFERTDSHRTRVHLTSAKQKSIEVLSRNRTKNNVPCMIYQRLGRCRAFESNRCPKVHDPKRVAICPKFLQGSCPLDDCLLSHNVTFAKMPTCKFFLAKMCVRPNCPYLHKKVNEKTEICPQFVSGFCPEAEKCPKRHEFLCPAFESKGVCDQPRCKLPHKSKESADRPHVRKYPTSAHNADDIPAGPSCPKPSVAGDRYFVDESDMVRGRAQRQLATHRSNSPPASEDDDDDVHQVIPSRPRLGTLPSFIPIE